MPPLTPNPTSVAALIQAAFTSATYPGDDDLVRSRGDEPDEVVAMFRGQTDWRTLAPDFLDRAGAASPSALSFFSGRALRFYLPAFLLADLRGLLRYTDLVFYLYHGLDDSTRNVPVQLPTGAATTWWDVQQEHLGHLSAREAGAIRAYLQYQLDAGALTPQETEHVRQAMANYWDGRARSGPR